MRHDLGKLQREGAHSATLRGHNLSPFTSLTDFRAAAVCFDCGMEVYVNAHPMPNEIDISGEAVALNCRKKVH